MNCNLAVIKGDGIGPEIVTEAMRVLDAVGEKYGHTFSYTQILMGGASIDVHGEPLTEEALEIAKNSDAVLMGSIGGNTSTSPWYKLPAQLRPEAGLLKIRVFRPFPAEEEWRVCRSVCLFSWRTPSLWNLNLTQGGLNVPVNQRLHAGGINFDVSRAQGVDNGLCKLWLMGRDFREILYTLPGRNGLWVGDMGQIAVNDLIHLIAAVPLCVGGNQNQGSGADIGIFIFKHICKLVKIGTDRGAAPAFRLQSFECAVPRLGIFGAKRGYTFRNIHKTLHFLLCTDM